MLHDPDLAQNLLSVRQLIDHGHIVNFEGRWCKVYVKIKNKIKLMANVRMEKNINFPLTLKLAENVTLKAYVDDLSWLWHKWLGYANFER